MRSFAFWKFSFIDFFLLQAHENKGGLAARPKRFAVVGTLLILGLIGSTTATTITTIDQHTDSEAFYPSIRGHKNTIRNFARKIQQKLPRIKRGQRAFEEKLRIAQQTKVKIEHWLVTMSKVKNLSEVHNLELAQTDLVVPAQLQDQIPLFANLMTPVNYAFLGLDATVQTLTLAVAGTLSTTSAALSGIGGSLAIVASGVQIGMTMQNGANKREQYRLLAERYRAQFATLQQAERDLDQLWRDFETFMTGIQERVETIVRQELRTPCNVGVHGEAVPDLVAALDQHWITILNGFTRLNEKFNQIKQAVSLLKESGARGQEVFFSVYQNYQDHSSLIVEAMKESGYQSTDFGHWGAWSSGSQCRDTTCGFRMKTVRRRCSTSSCIGNPFQKVVCSVENRDQGQRQTCDSHINFIDASAFDYYSAVIKHICSLSTDFVKYQGMNDAFTVRPSG